MRKLIISLSLGAFAGLASTQPAHAGSSMAAGSVYVVKQQRGFFDAIRLKRDLRPVCGGNQPVSVETKRTTTDALAAVFSGIMYTPAHLVVTCPAATSAGRTQP